jgi:hypothetical protein
MSSVCMSSLSYGAEALKDKKVSGFPTQFLLAYTSLLPQCKQSLSQQIKKGPHKAGCIEVRDCDLES